MGQVSKFATQQKFGWDVTALDEYKNEESQDLLRKTVFSGGTLDAISIQEGIKHIDKLKIFDVSPEWASGDSCGFTASGDVVFSDRDIAVVNVKDEKSMCNLDLLDKWTQKALRAGSIEELEDFPYQDAIITYFLEKNAKVLDQAVWQGDTSGSGNLARFDGFEKKMTAEKASMIDINTNSYTTFTASNAYDIVWNAYMDMDNDSEGEDVLDDGAVAFLTSKQFNLLVKNVTYLNLFHFDTQGAIDSGSFVIPGLDLTVQRFRGRGAQSKFFIAKASQLVFGTDLVNDANNVKIWYNEDAEEIRTRIRFKAGVQYPFPSQIGYFELAAS